MGSSEGSREQKKTLNLIKGSLMHCCFKSWVPSGFSVRSSKGEGGERVLSAGPRYGVLSPELCHLHGRWAVSGLLRPTGGHLLSLDLSLSPTEKSKAETQMLREHHS